MINVVVLDLDPPITMESRVDRLE